MISVGAKLCRDTGPPGSTFPTSGLTASPQPQRYLPPRRPKGKQCRFHGVMVSTLDFESSDLSSNLGGTVELLLRHEKKITNLFLLAFKVVYSLWLCDQHMLFSRFHGVLVSSLYSESRNPHSNLGGTWPTSGCSALLFWQSKGWSHRHACG